jgi:hypothetical protein
LTAARGKFEALGSLGDQVLDRTTPGRPARLVVDAGLPDREGAFNRRAADIAAYGASLDRVQASFDPLFGAMRRYETTLAEIAQAEQRSAPSRGGEAVAARQRAFAAVPSSRSPANASLAAELRSARYRGRCVMVDVQQAANRGAGVSTPLAGDALAARAEDIAAYGDALDRLQASFNPLVADPAALRGLARRDRSRPNGSAPSPPARVVARQQRLRDLRAADQRQCQPGGELRAAGRRHPAHGRCPTGGQSRRRRRGSPGW